jgi:hypothetical protein
VQIPIKRILGVGSATFITLAFTVPVGLVSLWTNPKTLSDHFPFVRNMIESSVMIRELLPYLPPFILVLLDNLIPPIYSVCCRTIFREVRGRERFRLEGCDVDIMSPTRCGRFLRRTSWCFTAFTLCKCLLLNAFDEVGWPDCPLSGIPCPPLPLPSLIYNNFLVRLSAAL